MFIGNEVSSHSSHGDLEKKVENDLFAVIFDIRQSEKYDSIKGQCQFDTSTFCYFRSSESVCVRV